YGYLFRDFFSTRLALHRRCSHHELSFSHFYIHLSSTSSAFCKKNISVITAMADSTSYNSTPNPSEQLCAASAQLPKTTSCQIKPVSAPQPRNPTTTPPSTQQNAESTTPLTKESLKKLQEQSYQSQCSSSPCDDEDDAVKDDAMNDSDVEDKASKILIDAALETRGLFEIAQACLDDSNRIHLGKRKREDARDPIAVTISDVFESETTHKRVQRHYFISEKEVAAATILVEQTRKLVEAKNERLRLMVMLRIVLYQMDKNHPSPDEANPSTNTPTLTNPILVTSLCKPLRRSPRTSLQN
ncbi:hypothetical protein EDD21DRAFT_435237, partial [Dissophora ornata]